MAETDKKPEFTKIKLKYPSLDKFAKAARTTFSKGRMTLKSKKDFTEGDRIILAFSIPETPEPVEIISEVIHKAENGSPGESGTYGVRWLNFTERKLEKLLKDPTSNVPKAPPAATEAAKQTPPQKEKEQRKEPEKKKAPPKPQKPEPAKKEKPAPPQKKQEKKKQKAGEEYIIDSSPDGDHPSFQDKPEVIVPPVSEGEEAGQDDDLDLDLGPDELEEATPARPPSPEEDAIPSPELEEDVIPAPEPEEEAIPAPEPEEDVIPAPEPEKEAPPAPEPEEDVIPAPEPEEDVTPAAPPEDSILDIEEEAMPMGDDDDVMPMGDEDVMAVGDDDAMPAGDGAEQEEPTAAAPPPPPPFKREEPEIASLGDPDFGDIEDGPGQPAEKSGSTGGPPPPPPKTKGPDIADGPGYGEPVSESIQEVEEILAATPLPEEDEIIEDMASAGAPSEDVLDDEIIEEKYAKTRSKPLTDEELTAFGDFLLKLIRTILQTERAISDEGVGNVKPLFEEFKATMTQRDEIGVYMRSAGSVQEFMLAGDIAEPVNLKLKMPAEQFQDLAMKMVDFFKNKELIGLQFRKYLTGDAFKAFMERMADYSPTVDTTEDLASKLLKEGVFHINPVHASDRIDVKNLDFRVDTTLARLRGDLKRLELSAEAIMEEPVALWTLRVEDALKALPSGILRAQVLLYGDKLVEGQDLISETDLSQDIVLGTPVEMLSEAAEYLAGLYEEAFARSETDKSDAAAKEGLERTRKVLRAVAGRLTVDFPEAAKDVMGGLYKKGVFTLDELPQELREQVMLEQYIDSFLQEPDKRLSDFGAMKSAKDYKISANRYARMVGELMRRKEIETADNIFQTLVSHIKDKKFPERQKLAREALSVLSNKRSLSGLIKAMSSADKGKRDKIAAMLFAAGPKAADSIIDQLAVEEDRSVRRLQCEILTRMGEKIAPVLKRRALDKEAPWFLVRNMVMILGDVKSAALNENIDWLINHEHPRVREEGLAYAVKITGVETEPMLVRALKDPDARVRARALRILNRFPDVGDAALLGAAEMLRAMPPKDTARDEEQAVAASADLLAKYGGRPLSDGRSIADVLYEVLETETSKGLLGRITGGRSTRTPKMKASLIDALGKTGSTESVKLVQSFAKDKDETVREAAQAAIKKIS